MKKVIGILTLLVLSSCGKVEVGATNGVGDFKSVNAVALDQNQLNSLSTICQAIVSKNLALPALVNVPYVFSYSSKKCSDSSVSSAIDIATTLQNSGSSYKFLQSNGSVFYFGEVETSTSGSLSRICSQMADSGAISNPIMSGNEVLFVTTGISNGDCPSVFDESCVSLEKGTIDTSGMAKIHTKEWIRFNIKSNSGKNGFYTFQKQITSQGCSEGAFSINQATLK